MRHRSGKPGVGASKYLFQSDQIVADTNWPNQSIVDANQPEKSSAEHFRALTRHFWGRSFFFHRSWTTEDFNKITARVLVGVGVRDSDRLKNIIEETFHCTTEALCRTFKAL